MKKIFFNAWLVLWSLTIQAQSGESPACFGHGEPDSIIQITMILPGTDQPRTLKVAVTDGWAKMEGDIVLGRIEDLQNPEVSDRGIVLESLDCRWPGGIVPYTIANPDEFGPAYLNAVLEAIDYINGTTNVYLVPATGQTDCIRFECSNKCESAVGRQGGTQTIKLQIGCGDFSGPIHEIGHALGMYHEQSREDRNNFVSIIWANIDGEDEINFQKENSTAMDIGPYDFSSVMHYAPLDFSNNGQPTIVALNGNQSFGNAGEFSQGDREAINYMYQSNSCPINMTLTTQIRSVARPMFFESDDFLTSSAAISGGNSVMYDAGVLIRLLPGFRVDANAGSTFNPVSVFRAVNDGCGGVYNMDDPSGGDAMVGGNGEHGTESTPSQPLASPTKAASTKLLISPNPVGDKAVISYALDVPQQVSLQVHNMTGERVSVLVPDEHQDAGEYHYELTPIGWPAGVYFVTLQQGDKSTTKRIVLIPK
ncbi:MAG: M12 family metallopeptidase [Saprospiraceae bacterium]